MFYEITSTQPIADLIKGLVYEVRPAGLEEARLRKRAEAAVQTLEGCPWRPVIFEQALEAHAGGRLQFAPDKAAYAPPAGSTRPGRDLLTDVIGVIEHYAAEMQIGEIFSVAEAAQYLGVSVPAVKHHIYNTGTLRGTLKGNSRVFTRAELDAWSAQRRGPGRPPTRRNSGA